MLVATDSPILLVLRLSDWGVVRRLYGLDVDKFHNASVAWHRSSSYIMAGGWGRQTAETPSDALLQAMQYMLLQPCTSTL